MGAEVEKLIKDNGQEIGLVGTFLGAGTKAFGQITEGKAIREQAAYQSAILRQNKLIADQAAEQALQKGNIVAQENQIKTAQSIGLQRSTLAGRNIVVDQDTALAMAQDTARLGKMDEQQILIDAGRDALALKMQGANFEAQANLTEMKGRNAYSSGFTSAGGTLLGAAANVASKWAVFNKDSEPALKPATRQIWSQAEIEKQLGA